MTGGDSARAVKVMLVDDSIIIRSLLARMLRESPDIDIVGMAANGQEAVEKCAAMPPDVILLDLEMPVMDGLSAIPHLQRVAPQARIILCSAQSEKGADVTLRGLSLGASDFILKPSALTGPENKNRFREQLLERIHHMASPARKPAAPGRVMQPFALSPRASTAIPRPSILAIGSSTGGPNALSLFFRTIRRLPVPIVITQHMPKTFTRILADQLAKCGDTPCVEAEDGMAVAGGCAYVAPGDRHIQFRHDGGSLLIRLSDDPPENFCRPAVDPMLRSLTDIYGDKVLAVIFTGMGADGLEGCRRLVAAGGHVLAQDEASAVVWGMPGAVAKAGLCSYVDNVGNIAKKVQQVMDQP